jgi:hypothetical protein
LCKILHIALLSSTRVATAPLANLLFQEAPDRHPFTGPEATQIIFRPFASPPPL